MEFSNCQMLDYGEVDSFVALLSVDGAIELTMNGTYTTLLSKGEIVLLPAIATVVQLMPVGAAASVLEVFVE